MGIAKTIISVAIIGDAKKLIGAVKTADAGMGGLLKSAAKGFIAFKAVDETFDFIGDSLGEADRMGDALARLGTQLPPEFVTRLEDTADNFSKIGASSQDMLELEAIFADFATTLGLTDEAIAGVAEQAAATAVALSLIDDQGRDASAVMDLIKAAAGGSAKAARELGVTLIAGADATTQMSNILAQLAPRLELATKGTGDLEQRQAALSARVETLQGQLGEQLAPALADVLTIITDGIDDIDGAIWGFQRLGDVIVGFARTVLGPLGNVRDAIEGITNAVNGAPSTSGFDRKDVSDSRQRQADNRNRDRNGITRERIGGV